MEDRKKTEINYYNEQSLKWLSSLDKKKNADFEGFNPFLLSSFRYIKNYLKDRCQGKILLDYGCGNGVHSFWLAKAGAEVVGIDLSEKSLEIAGMKAKKDPMVRKVSFLQMDCEKLDFPDNHFDIIFDGGTFSSLDINTVYPELVRVLKPNGYVIGIETFGHNPFTNFKRILNKITGKRTGWAASHIFNMSSYQKARDYFVATQISFFHPFSWILIPFLKFGFVQNIMPRIERWESTFANKKLFQKLAFKVVFIFSNPKK